MINKRRIKKFTKYKHLILVSLHSYVIKIILIFLIYKQNNFVNVYKINIRKKLYNLFAQNLTIFLLLNLIYNKYIFGMGYN